MIQPTPHMSRLRHRHGQHNKREKLPTALKIDPFHAYKD